MSAEFEALGAQYREARDAVPVHRRRQAAAEITLGRLQRRHGPDHPDVAAARAAVTKLHHDVRWCQATAIAAAEAFKGCRFDDVPNGPVATMAEAQR
jgi:hypothetical protein